jgi:hypothetical protein
VLDRYLLTAEVARLLGCDAVTLVNGVTRGLVFPPPRKFGRAFAWADDDIARARHYLAHLRPKGRPRKAVLAS